LDPLIPVLTWHKVDTRREPGITRVSPGRFRGQVEHLADGGWTSLSAGEFVRRGGRAPRSERLCLICFDDAYDCVEVHAAPVLEDHGFSGVLFPVMDYIGRENRWDAGLLGRRFRHLDEGGIRRLLERGWSLGLHGRSHRTLRGASLEVLEREVVEARAELELRFDREVRLLAWPFGLCDRRAVNVASAAGIRLAFGSGERQHPLDLPRYMIYPPHGGRSLESMLRGGAQDPLQKLARAGARLSAKLGRSFLVNHAAD